MGEFNQEGSHAANHLGRQIRIDLDGIQVERFGVNRRTLVGVLPFSKGLFTQKALQRGVLGFGLGVQVEAEVGDSWDAEDGLAAQR